jgi:2-polyprenyl-3-methyl-5-hydroxy-6-metoxy-1,4-benzoquinol methylase
MKIRAGGCDLAGASAFRALNLAKEEEVIDRVNIHNARSDVMNEGSYDFITTFDVIHDSVDPQGLIKDVRRALRADGTYQMIPSCQD